MKHLRVLKILAYLTGVILIVALGYGLFISNEIKNKTESINFTTRSDYKYHLMLLLRESDEMYTSEFMDGVNKYAQANNIAIESVLIKQTDYLTTVLDRLDMAIYAKVDGIVLHAYDNPEIIDKINQATEMGIPVITLNENVHMSKRVAHVGSSKYTVGLTVGKTIAELLSGEGDVAIIDQFSYSKQEMDLLGLGISDVFGEYDQLNLVSTRYTEEGVLSAESVAIKLLNDFPHLDIIYCTNGPSTLGIVQVLIDRNVVNDIDVVGTGLENEIISYIQNGQVVDATIVTDYYEIGINAVEAFHEYMETGVVSSQIMSSVKVINPETIDAFLNEKEESHENE